MNKVKKEKSAGGIVVEEGKILLVKVRNLSGDIVWTFPKGHIEKGETEKDAALREVFEETGYKCKIGRKIYSAAYSFFRGETKVDKEVFYYMMRRVSGDGIPVTKDEIIETAWFSLKEAERELVYPGDRDILEILKRRFKDNGRNGNPDRT